MYLLYVGMYHDFVADDLSIKFLRMHIITVLTQQQPLYSRMCVTGIKH